MFEILHQVQSNIMGAPAFLVTDNWMMYITHLATVVTAGDRAISLDAHVKHAVAAQHSSFM